MTTPEPKPVKWPCNESFFRGRPTEEPSQPGTESPEMIATNDENGEDRIARLIAERDALKAAAKELVTRWDEVRRGLRDPSCLEYANELALSALAKGGAK